jgi:ATP synthase protein I
MALLYGRALRHAEHLGNPGESSSGGHGSGGFVAGPGDRERGTPGDEEKGLSSLAAGYQKAAPYMAASMTLVASVGFFTWAGIWLDRKLGTSAPWFTLLGAVVGMTGGFISFFKTVLRKKA